FRVPADITSSGSADLSIERDGIASNPILVHVVPFDPGLLSADGSGRGQAAARNDDGTLNTPDNPARAGSMIRLYFTGANADPTNLAVQSGGKMLNVLSAAPLGGFFPGLSEAFVQLESSADQSVALTVLFRFLIGGYSQYPRSPPLTISVR